MAQVTIGHYSSAPTSTLSPWLPPTPKDHSLAKLQIIGVWHPNRLFDTTIHCPGCGGSDVVGQGYTDPGLLLGVTQDVALISYAYKCPGMGQ